MTYIPSCYADNHKYEKNWLIFDRIKPFPFWSTALPEYEVGRFSAYLVTNTDGSEYCIHLHMIDGEYDIEVFQDETVSYHSFDEVKDFLIHHQIIVESDTRLNDKLLRNLVNDTTEWGKNENNEWFAKFPGEDRNLKLFHGIETGSFSEPPSNWVPPSDLKCQNIEYKTFSDFQVQVRWRDDEVWIYSTLKDWKAVYPTSDIRHQLMCDIGFNPNLVPGNIDQRNITFDLNSTVKLWR